MGVGAGEAAISPAAYSIMSDLFPKDRLAGPISVYTMGGTLGAALSVYVGGTLLQYFSIAGGVRIGAFAVLQPWQALFVVTAGADAGVANASTDPNAIPYAFVAIAQK